MLGLRPIIQAVRAFFDLDLEERFPAALFAKQFNLPADEPLPEFLVTMRRQFIDNYREGGPELAQKIHWISVCDHLRTHRPAVEPLWVGATDTVH